MAFHQELNIVLILRNSVSLRQWEDSIEWPVLGVPTHITGLLVLILAGAIFTLLCGLFAIRSVHTIRAQTGAGADMWRAGRRELGVAVLLGAALGAWVSVRYGVSAYSVCLLAALGVLGMLAIIDARTGLLPDALTLPLIWAGLILAWLDILPVSLHQSVGGAIVGYGFLWALAVMFYFVRGKEGMGHGDFKLTAALGAWMGYGLLPFTLLLACILGLMVVVVIYGCKRVCYAKTGKETGSILARTLPFGPYLVLSGALALLVFQTR